MPNWKLLRMLLMDFPIAMPIKLLNWFIPFCHKRRRMCVANVTPWLCRPSCGAKGLCCSTESLGCWTYFCLVFDDSIESMNFYMKLMRLFSMLAWFRFSSIYSLNFSNTLLTTSMFLGQFISPLVSQPLSLAIGLNMTYGVAGIAMAILAITLVILLWNWHN